MAKTAPHRNRPWLILFVLLLGVIVLYEPVRWFALNGSDSFLGQAASCAVGASCGNSCDATATTPLDHPAGKPYLCTINTMTAVYGYDRTSVCTCTPTTRIRQEFVETKDACDALCSQPFEGASSMSSARSAASVVPNHGGYCCIGGNFCSQSRGCSFPNCSSCNIGSSSSRGSIVSTAVCPADACDNGGEVACQSIGKSCANTSDFPCARCADMIGCTSNADCPSDEQCSGGACRLECNAPAQCISNQCIDGICHCSGDSQCPSGFACMSGECKHGHASSAASGIASSSPACSGTECADGGNTYCRSLGKVCHQTATFPCIQCADASS